MRKTVFWMAALLAVGAVSGSYAQSGVKYPYVQEGKIIVSRDEQGGVKTSALHPNWTASDMPSHTDRDAANAVAARFELALHDCDATTSPGVSNSGGKYNITNALLACSKYVQAGTAVGSWRLPTQKEGLLIWMFLDKLTAIDAFNFTAANGSRYYTATLLWSILTNNYSINTPDNQMYPCRSVANKGDYNRARCVRDL